jgi:hypothetical protein
MRHWILACAVCLVADPFAAGQHRAQGLPDVRDLLRLPDADKLPPPPPEPSRDDRLDAFRKLRITDEDAARIRQLIGHLDAPVYKDRQKATTALLAEGPRALPLLHQALAGATLEKRTRLENCIKALDTPQWRADMVARLESLKQQPSDKATAILLTCAPYVAGETFDELVDTLWQLREASGKLDPRFADALADSEPARRGVAALMVGWYGTKEQRERVRKLLDDADATVRFRAAQGLLAAGDKQAVPVLIAALAKGDLAIADHAEGLLQLAAGDTAPKALLTADADGRAKCHAAWDAWWDQHKDRLELANLEVAFSGEQQRKRAEKAALDFLTAVFKTQDFKLLEKVTAVPFHVPDSGLLENRAAFDAYFAKLKELPREFTEQIHFKAKKTLTPQQAVESCQRPVDRDYLNSLPRSGRVMVQISVTFQGQPEDNFLVLVVRVTGTRAQVTGVCQAR